MAIQMDGWVTIANRYVAVIDIMGFKNMVARSTQKQIYDMMFSINDKVRTSVNTKWIQKIDQKMVSTTSYSDSIMIYSKGSDSISFKSLMLTLSSITNDLLTECIPHKGAIAFGEMTLDTENAIYFGQPLIDAFLLQEELKFYGIILHSSAEQEISRAGYGKDTYFLINYKCSFKQGEADHFTIVPMFAAPPDDDAYLSEKEALYKSIKGLRGITSGHLRVFVDNTEKFLNSFIGLTEGWDNDL